MQSRNWSERAKCIGVDPDIFFPPREKELYKDVAEKAKAVCFGKDGKMECPVRKNCLLYAIEADEQYGIWGGLSPRERGALKRKAIRENKTTREYLYK